METINDLFLAFDTNNTGYLTRDQLRQLVRQQAKEQGNQLSE
jgi:Ca2+-binding EF-hand superfamily protein